MKISDRLRTIGDMVDDHSSIIDVGCDHAWLDIYLIHKHIGITAIASDVALGPLEHAKRNISSFQMVSMIQVKQGNGLEPMGEDTDTIIISGMGGKTMLGIFKNNLAKLAQASTILLSPNSDVELIRTFLVKNGFYLVLEELVFDHHVIYPILKFKKGCKKYKAIELYFGPILLQKKSSLFYQYYGKELKRKEVTLQLLPSKYIRKRWKLKKEIFRLRKILNQK